ncbi:hypothetical protein BV25DRAFT_1913128 [Artomyces pyxidatus]|uniref:Uncharacterized protein n=1 Tax=Artomyces pyxidatus TaxID=48021 RepID=A0ACB8TA35_9AGAM|nr:hypothetical protein BV25DRAFT_1913128 [Artomyces pyxidatus]
MQQGRSAQPTVPSIPLVPYKETNFRELLPGEEWWRDNQAWLEERGYTLRPRYRVGWQPSWDPDDPFDRLRREDGWYSRGRFSIVDATRSNGTYVFLKKIPPEPEVKELEVIQYVNSEPLASDPRNHSVSLLEVLEPPDGSEKISVTPLLRPFDDPRFETFGEAVAFFDQIFECLQFLHEHHVAHRDCTVNNIMMDGSMYPDSFHPIVVDRRRDWKGKAKHYTRTQRPLRYYFIDFGLSDIFKPEDGPPLVQPVRGGDKSAPEHSGDNYYVLHDPFPTDVYYLGNLIRENFVQKYYGFEFILPLMTDMVAQDPSKRPNIEQVVSRFRDIRGALSSWKLRSRMRRRKEIWPLTIYLSVGAWCRRLGYIVTRTPAIPVPRK